VQRLLRVANKRNNRLVDFDRDPPRWQIERSHQVGHGCAVGNLSRLAVDNNVHAKRVFEGGN
jgi:hypothetical protein